MTRDVILEESLGLETPRDLLEIVLVLVLNSRSLGLALVLSPKSLGLALVLYYPSLGLTFV